jgi:L-lactate dehydrogenase complex protein LldG
MELTMSENSRERIFARLKSAVGPGAELVPETACLPIETFSQGEKIDKLKTLMEAMRTEVHLAGAQNWIDKLIEILTRRKVKQLLSHQRPAPSLKPVRSFYGLREMSRA